MEICSFLFLLSLFSLCLDANPGIKVKITQKGVDFGMQLGTELLKQRLKNTVFDDWHGLTGLNYTVSNITIQHIEFPRNSVFLIPGTGIHLRVNEASATVTADWRFTTWLFRSSGKLIVYVRGMIISATATVSQDEAGHPMLFLKSCNGSVDNIDIQLDESSRWFYRVFANFMERPLRNNFNLNLCPSINLEIQRINAELKQHQVRTQVDAYAVIDYSLVNLPSISHTSIDVDFKGTVYSTVNETEPSFEPDSFILPTMSDFMLYIGISEYFFHSASLAYYTSGAFEVSTEKELSTYFNLTTEIFNSIIPMVAYLHRRPCPVIMNLTATAAPVISLQNGRFILELSSSMEVLKVQQNLTICSMFILNVTARTHVSLTIFENNLIPTLCLDSFNLSLAHSSVGFFKASLLENFMSYILQKGIIPSINVNLKDGIPLPVLDTTVLVKPVVTVHQGYLLISTDVRFKPSYIWEHSDLQGLQKM